MKVCDETTLTFFVDNSVCEDPDDCSNLIDFEDFEWGLGIWNDGGNDCYWNYEPAQGGNSSNYCMRLQDNSWLNSSMYTDYLSLAGVNNMQIDFMYLPESMEYQEDFLLEYTNNDNNWTTIKSWASGIDFDNGIFYSETISFSGNFTNSTRFRFRCDASTIYDKVYLDNIAIYACGSGSFAPIEGDQVASREDQISEEEIVNEINLYPNPVLDKLYIESETKELSYKLFEETGRLILTGNNPVLELSNFKPGVYHLMFSDGQHRRFVKM